MKQRSEIKLIFYQNATGWQNLPSFSCETFKFSLIQNVVDSYTYVVYDYDYEWSLFYLEENPWSDLHIIILIQFCWTFLHGSSEALGIKFIYEKVQTTTLDKHC